MDYGTVKSRIKPKVKEPEQELVMHNPFRND